MLLPCREVKSCLCRMDRAGQRGSTYLIAGRPAATDLLTSPATCWYDSGYLKKNLGRRLIHIPHAPRLILIEALTAQSCRWRHMKLFTRAH